MFLYYKIKNAIIYFKCLIAGIKTVFRRSASIDELSYSNLYGLLCRELNLTRRRLNLLRPFTLFSLLSKILIKPVLEFPSFSLFIQNAKFC